MLLLSDDRYSLTADGLHILGVRASDEGDYTCRAAVESDGRYEERRIHVEVHGKFTYSYSGISVMMMTMICSAPPCLKKQAKLVHERSALSDPYCQFAWNSVCVCVCVSEISRSNISETVSDVGSVTMGSL